MRHAVLGGGKRLRPRRVMMTAEACGANDAELKLPSPGKSWEDRNNLRLSRPQSRSQAALPNSPPSPGGVVALLEAGPVCGDRRWSAPLTSTSTPTLRSSSSRSPALAFDSVRRAGQGGPSAGRQGERLQRRA